MAAIKNAITCTQNFIFQNLSLPGFGFQQIRNKAYVDKWMIRDLKRRRLANEYADERLRMLVMKRNKVLPVEFREMVGKEFSEKIPRRTAKNQLVDRCILTSKPRGVVYKWRVSRMIFRHLADYNKLSGVQRAMW